MKVVLCCCLLFVAMEAFPVPDLDLELDLSSSDIEGSDWESASEEVGLGQLTHGAILDGRCSPPPTVFRGEA